MGLIAALGGIGFGLLLIALGGVGLIQKPSGPKRDEVPEYVWLFLIILGCVMIGGVFGA